MSADNTSPAPLTDFVVQLESLSMPDDDINSLSEREFFGQLNRFLDHLDYCRKKENLKRIPPQEMLEHLQIYIYDEHNKIIVHNPRSRYESFEFLADLHNDLKQTIKSSKLKGDYDNVRDLIILREELRILRNAKLIRKN